jgi:hypothetical protein
MAAGAGYGALKLRQDVYLVNAYCPHHEAGAALLVEPGRPLRWQIISPIDAIEWPAFVATKAQATKGALDGFRGPEKVEGDSAADDLSPPPPPEVH